MFYTSFWSAFYAWFNRDKILEIQEKKFFHSSKNFQGVEEPIREDQRKFQKLNLFFQKFDQTNKFAMKN